MISDLCLILKKESRFLFLTMMLALSIRMILFICYTRYENYRIPIDSYQYHEIALQFAQNNGLSLKNGEPNFYRLPGYPFFLGILYKIFGTYYKKALYVQIILSIIEVPLIFILAFTIFPEYFLVSKLAALATALHPGFTLFAGLLASETLFLILFLPFLIFFFLGIKNHKILFFFLAGISLGIASLFRALGHYVILLAVIQVLMFVKKSFYKRLYLSIILFCSWISIFGLWLIRNYILTGLIFVHAITGQHFLRYNAVHILMDIENVSWMEPHKKLFNIRDKIVAQRELIENRKLIAPEKDKIAMDIAVPIIFTYPLLAIKNACKQVFITCSSMYSLMTVQLPPETFFSKSTPTSYKIKMYLLCFKAYPILIIFVLWDLLFSFMLLLGMSFFIFFGLQNRNLRKICLLIFPLMALIVGTTLSFGCARLRFPIEPFLIILSIYGLMLYWQNKNFNQNQKLYNNRNVNYEFNLKG